MSDLSILHAAREVPDRVALVDDGGACTFAELAELAMGSVEASSERVLIAPRPTRDDVAWLLGLLERRTSFVLAHARWTAVELADAIERTRPARVRVDGRTEITPHREAGREQALLFTSGSSGRPKIVRLAHAALEAAARAHAGALPWRDDDAWVLCLPLGHIGGLSVLTRSLYARRPVVLAPERFDPSGLIDTLDRHRGTLVSLVPTMLARLCDRPPPASLRAALLGGAAASPALVERAREAGWPVLPTYGASETCAQICTQRLGDERPLGVGPPLPGLEVRIRDGEIEARGPTLMLGYLDDPSPLVEGWYRTGDRGYLDTEGHLRVQGRTDDRLITGGENVDPTEVEEALLTHPGIVEALVLGVPDPEWGQRVVAMIAGSDLPDDEALEAYLDGRLARFKHPRRVARASALPRLVSGKVDRLAVLGALDAPGRVSGDPSGG